jgi:hypothetical protein
LPHAAQASFNSYDKEHDPTCLPNTRLEIRRYIITWADGQDARHIFWLNGMAGTGKSTIARTVARYFYDQKRLGASFFFSRGGGDVGHANKFFTTIAWQLANTVPPLKRYICEAISEHNDIATQTLRDQWNQLIYRPLLKLDNSSFQLPLVLIIDALDECDIENDIQRILQLLAEARGLRNVRLRILVTSRPEIPIRHGFYNIPETERQDFVLHNISSSVINHDIAIFLEYNLGIIRQECFLGMDWPGEQTIRDLVEKAGGLFIWAATACRFIRGGHRFASKRLVRILHRDTVRASPEEKLNEIYKAILTNCIRNEYDDLEKEELCKTFKEVVGTIVILSSPLSSASLGRLLQILSGGIAQTLDEMHSILEIPKDEAQPIRLHHPSFRDFLLDERRCGDRRFWVYEPEAHRILSDCCIQLMSKQLKRDICGLHDLGALARDVQDNAKKQYLPPELQYACLNWVQHLQKSETVLLDNGPAHIFLCTHLLHWLEALSIIEKISESILAIALLESSVKVSLCPSKFTRFLLT